MMSPTNVEERRLHARWKGPSQLEKSLMDWELKMLLMMMVMMMLKQRTKSAVKIDMLNRCLKVENPRRRA